MSEQGIPLAQAFRAPTLTADEADAFRGARRTEIACVLSIPVLVVGGILLGRLPLGKALPLTALAALAWGFWNYWHGRRQFAQVVRTPLLLVAGILGVRGASMLLEARTISVVALAAATLFLVPRYGARPLRFYQLWLLAEPGTTMEQWSARVRYRPRPSIIALALLLAIVAIVPWRHSTTLAIALVLLVAAGLVAIPVLRRPGDPWKNLTELYQRFRFLMHLYLAYPDQGPRGTWAPESPQPVRRRTYLLSLVPLSLAVLAGLTLCCPWEIFAAWTIPGFRWIIPPGSPTAGSAEYGWLLQPLAAAKLASAEYLWCFVIAVPLAVFLPGALLFVVCAPALSRIVEEKTMGARDFREQTLWDQYVDRLRGSSDPVEREHLFLGTYPMTGAPALLHRSILEDHAYIVGQPGSGKTTLGVMPILIQLIRGRGEAEPPPIVVLDLKGDPALFHTAMAEAAGRTPAPQEVRYFRLEPGCASHCFNPFTNLRAEKRTPIELAELFVQALNLFHGDYYGASYYSRQHRELLLSFFQDHPRNRPTSIEGLYNKLKDYAQQSGNREKAQDTLELLATIHALASYPQLRSGPSHEAIFMPDVIQRGQLVYFYLESAVANMSVREVAKLALYSLLTSVKEYHQSGKALQRPRQVYVVIDEFQRIAAENLRVILQQARGLGISLILANQDPNDLRLPNIDLRSTVYTDTRMQQYFTVTDPHERERLISLSGEKSVFLTGYRQTVGQTPQGATSSYSVSQQETIRPRLTSDEIRAVTDAPLDSLLHIVRGAGLTQLGSVPTRIRTPRPLHEHVYRERLNSPWPTRPTDAPAEPTPAPSEVDREMREFTERKRRDLMEFFDNKLQQFAPASAPGKEDKSDAGRAGDDSAVRDDEGNSTAKKT